MRGGSTSRVLPLVWLKLPCRAPVAAMAEAKSLLAQLATSSFCDFGDEQGTPSESGCGGPITMF